MISVIISVYNVAPYIEKCINSIRQQTYADLEIIAVDDGSIDDSGKICDELAKIDSRIVVIHKENGGTASARNIGINVAKGEFITFVDSDDYIENDAYENMLAEMERQDISFVTCGIIVTNVDGVKNIVTSQERKCFTREEALEDFYKGGGNILPTVCTKLFRKAVFEKAGQFKNEIDHEDTEIIPRLLDASKQIVVLNKAYYNYIKRTNSKTLSKKFNLRGYRFLDAIDEHEQMCKSKFANILPYFYHYQLVTLYESLIYLLGCYDYKKYFKQHICLRCRIIKAVCKCWKYKNIREEYADEIKVMLLRTILEIYKALGR